MIFPARSDYPDNLDILEHHTPTQARLYVNLIEASASAYFESDNLSRYFLMRKFYFAESLLKGRMFEKIMDAGTGIGFFLPYLSGIAKEVVGIERNEALVYAREMIRKRSLSNVIIDQQDILSLPYKDNSFDCITSLSVLDGFSQEELRIVFSSFRRLLRPGGVLLVGYSTENSFFRFIHNRLTFLFGKRLRTKQILDASGASGRVFANPRTMPDTIEAIAEKTFRFRKIGIKMLSFLFFIPLYRVVLFERGE